MVVYRDIRLVMAAPANVALRLTRSAMLLSYALENAAREGQDPLCALLASSLRASKSNDPAPGTAASTTPGGTRAGHRSGANVRWLRDLGEDAASMADGLATLLRDRWPGREYKLWEWLFFDRPTPLRGRTPIEALETGEGDAVVGLLAVTNDPSDSPPEHATLPSEAPSTRRRGGRPEGTESRRMSRKRASPQPSSST
jgi:hypothetical protein